MQKKRLFGHFSQLHFIAVFFKVFSGGDFIAENAGGAAKAAFFVKADGGRVVHSNKKPQICSARGAGESRRLFDRKRAEAAARTVRIHAEAH